MRGREDPYSAALRPKMEIWFKTVVLTAWRARENTPRVHHDKHVKRTLCTFPFAGGKNDSPRAIVRGRNAFPKNKKLVGTPMKGNDFKRWRKHLDLSQKEAADALGLKRRVLQYYEKGERDGDPVKIPRTVRLACSALAAGTEDYHGPEKDKKDKKKKKKGDEA